MNTNQTRDELFGRHLQGELSDVEKEHVAELLDSDAAARQQFVEFAQWDTELGETIREHAEPVDNADLLPSGKGTRERGGGNTFFLSPFATISTIVVLFILFSSFLYLQIRTGFAPEEKIVLSQTTSSPIATITGLKGSLLWTGNQGEVVLDMHVGRELTGGTIEGLAPDSWFELQFQDGSIVTISGTSMLTFADVGQKKLRLKQGAFTADVVPQPVGRPMIIQTPSTVIEVVGTRFEVEALQAFTTVNVREGNVRLKHLVDGNAIDIPADYRVIAEAGGDLSPMPLPAAENYWKSQLDVQAGGFGKWLPAIKKRPAAQKALPFIPVNNPKVNLSLLSIPVSGRSGPPVVLTPHATFRVRGRLHDSAQVHFGIAVSYDNGEFAGMFRGDLLKKQPVSEIAEEKEFEAVYQLSDFTVDPCVREKQDSLARTPDGLYLDRLWIFTDTGRSSGLMVHEVELIPGEIR